MGGILIPRLPALRGQDMIAGVRQKPVRGMGAMRQKMLAALLLAFVGLSVAACDKCGNFLGQPVGQPRGCK